MQVKFEANAMDLNLFSSTSFFRVFPPLILREICVCGKKELTFTMVKEWEKRRRNTSCVSNIHGIQT